MNNLNLETSLLVSDQIKSTSTSIDESLANIANLTSAIVDAARASELAPADSQNIFRSMSESFSQVVEGRERFVAAHKDMITLKLKSNHVETDFGCLGDGPLVNPQRGQLKAVS